METLNATSVGEGIVINIGGVTLGIHIVTTVIFIHIASINHSIKRCNLSLQGAIISTSCRCRFHNNLSGLLGIGTSIIIDVIFKILRH